ncbi:hypothetical protein [Salirhabdus salicampi]|uniref:YqgU-like beta propeller domain-containing protein n=1 Tax=Salirhabdus salicampi TaxID=476102 RepID=UPI0020C5AA92|nr:hypothetical protein [Salirhabdus salicampi]MCP8616856.1 hypothetical protein [Salirhabdus salicampi]
MINRFVIVFLPIVSFLFITTACINQYEGKGNHAVNNISLISKKSLGLLHRDNLAPIDEDGFVSILTWFDNDHIFYVRNNNDIYQIMKFNIYNGNQSVFFETSYEVLQLKASHHKRYFALELQEGSNRYYTILSDTGAVLEQIDYEADYVEMDWNPYIEEQLLLSFYSQKEKPSVYLLDIHEEKGQFTQLPVDPLVLWYGPTQVVYFDWTDEPTLSASTHLYDIRSGEKEYFMDHVYMFKTTKEQFLSITGKQQRDQIQLKFYNKQEHREESVLTMPSLETHAGYVWTPPFEWNETRQVLFTYKPKQHSSLLKYKDGYQFIAFHKDTGKEQLITTVEHASRLDCSSDGQRCLIGDDLENLVVVESGHVIGLLKRDRNREEGHSSLH